ncbi:MAG: hypothetical protein ABH874_06540 [Methanobacteriota archaeon]
MKYRGLKESIQISGKLVRKAGKNGDICTVIKRYKGCDIVVEFAHRQSRIDVVTIVQ